MDHPFSWTAASHHRFKYQANGSALMDDGLALSWMESQIMFTNFSLSTFSAQTGNLVNLAFLPSTAYSFLMQSTYDPASQNNMSIGPVGSYYRFIYTTTTEK
jgi:hypothetical protein